VNDCKKKRLGNCGTAKERETPGMGKITGKSSEERGGKILGTRGGGDEWPKHY